MNVARWSAKNSSSGEKWQLRYSRSASGSSSPSRVRTSVARRAGRRAWSSSLTDGVPHDLLRSGQVFERHGEMSRPRTTIHSRSPRAGCAPRCTTRCPEAAVPRGSLCSCSSVPRHCRYPRTPARRRMFISIGRTRRPSPRSSRQSAVLGPTLGNSISRRRASTSPKLVTIVSNGSLPAIHCVAMPFKLRALLAWSPAGLINSASAAIEAPDRRLHRSAALFNL